MDWEQLARIVHVVCVVFWIGGVAMVTTVMLPVLKEMDKDSDAFKLFHTFEKKFARQARLTTAITAISGITMLWTTHGWSRFLEGAYWWLHAMVLIWLLFTIMLFIIEPFVLPRMITRISPTGARRVFPIMQRLHVILLIGSVIAIMGAVGGSHGMFF
ncbi:MAG: hypothetical protein HQL84_18315 [Magnetococcales bacterium]|nr:hypothetical protein [Magnetococcales bacterium]MBF0151974.1 hypothetical protein [Magnetococcales bacterium]MBF0349016.1 hypothetical protein [Magnetococcales bacterium]MBF0632712.1 hypothetical protein [Magnetococcales bacterium]